MGFPKYIRWFHEWCEQEMTVCSSEVLKYVVSERGLEVFSDSE